MSISLENAKLFADVQNMKSYNEAMLESMSNGLTFYRRKHWLDAIKEFEEVLASHPADKPSKLYIERCRHFIEVPPPEEWDGVWVMESK